MKPPSSMAGINPEPTLLNAMKPSNRSGHATERHDVKTHFQDVEKNDRGSEHSRNSQNCNQRDLPIPKENQQNESGQNHADQDRIARAVLGRDDEIALVVPVGDLHPIRNLFSYPAQLGLDATRNFHRVS